MLFFYHSGRNYNKTNKQTKLNKNKHKAAELLIALLSKSICSFVVANVRSQGTSGTAKLLKC